jgi:G3E family GTPase
MTENITNTQPNDVPKIPVTVITGFLGSGKTTLLNHILTDKNHKKRIAIIENEVSNIFFYNSKMGTQLGVHNEVHNLEHASCVAEIVETTNGCICCSGK